MTDENTKASTDFSGASASITLPLRIGDSYQGGKIFYIDGTGLHGLIAATSDISTGAPWGDFGLTITGADGTAIGTGNQNTIDIMAGCATPGIAARLCGDLVQGGYSDWYLPSKDELEKLYINRTAVGNFFNVQYWSSSERDSYDVWMMDFSNGNKDYLDKYYNSFRVRAIRSF